MDKGHEWLLDLGRNIPGLESLNLASTGIEEGDVNDALVFLVQRCKGLNSLKVGEMELEKFKEIMKYSTTTLLELGTGCYSMRNGAREELTFDAAFIPWVSRLKVLDLKFMNLNAEGHCQLLACCPLLEELEVRLTLMFRWPVLITCKVHAICGPFLPNSKLMCNYTSIINVQES